MRTSRIFNAPFVALLSLPLAFGSLAQAGLKNPSEVAAKKEQAEEKKSERKKTRPPVRAERQQPVKPQPPAMETVTFLGVAAQPVGAAVRAQIDLPPGVGIAAGEVLKDSPAAKAGIRQFDVLTKFDDQILVTGEQLQTLVRMKKPGDEIELTLLRAAKEMTVKVTLSSHRFPARAAAPHGHDFPVAPGDRRFGPPGRWDRDPWDDRWKQLGEAWSKGMEEWLEKHGKDLEENARKFLDENFGDPDTWEPKMKKWIEEDLQPRIETHVRQFANVHATIVDEDGKVEITMKDGRKHVTATDPGGKVIFKGFCETEAERKKVPKDILKKVDRVKVDVKFDALDELKKNLEKPPVKPAPKKSSGKKEDTV